MTHAQWIVIASLLGAAGLWLVTPGRRPAWRAVGALAASVSLGLLAARLHAIEGFAPRSVFGILASVTAVAAVGVVAAYNPIYSALWFALSLLGAAGLFILQGAEFLGVATIVVYAGAIVVTFLFVLMLAQPDGTAFYDRIGWSSLGASLSALVGAALVGLLTYTLGATFEDRLRAVAPEEALTAGVLDPQHAAALGGELFARHLLEIEIAGVLLFVALVGAAAMTLERRRRPFAEKGPSDA